MSGGSYDTVRYNNIDNKQLLEIYFPFFLNRKFTDMKLEPEYPRLMYNKILKHIKRFNYPYLSFPCK